MGHLLGKFHKVTLSLSRKVNVTSVHNLLRHDQNRAKALMALGGAKEKGIFLEGAVINEQVENQAVSYIASVGVGSPPTIYSLVIDTGSSNTWVGASKAYVKTSTSTQTSSKVSVSYGSGSFSGTEFIDQVTLAAGLVIPEQLIGVASTSTGFDGVDGILPHIGPVGLTSGTLSPNTGTIPTVTDNLFKNSVISANTLGISIQPITQNNVVNGELTWGGTDSSKLTGSTNLTPLTTTSPASQFWGINQSIRYGTSTSILSSTAGIVDTERARLYSDLCFWNTRTTLVLIATDGFNKYTKATAAVFDSATGLLRITSAIAEPQVLPRSLNSAMGGAAGNIYLIIGDLCDEWLAIAAHGLDFINGYAFLERFYSVYDTANNRVGFATTPFTTAITN
ncbi:hypothetical protein K443DRAFT_133220 [Laccaria amethystina LaAM-08-1]|uniref:Unplaced genomic scaffold K443scaffold_121, whole genome shotgun sequence n=1 Tax=Laccaria amethystina LaAM-08-1 TaxID=1095629 RepID=A0A0C9XT08_9AGAR|nr:hypothetical protein K443DRAFT_133220 [Laccaria amethystina LaAM-08-1]